MKFIADLHVHSRFSRATAKNLDLEHLYIAAQLKGITVVGTGDFTHPGWFAEIQEKLVPAEPGLYRLKDDIADICDQQVPASCRESVRFILQCEISNIYKKNDKTRKNHNLAFMPDLDSASRFSARLDEIGNIKSDGRPILGLDARNLLEILLETSDQSFLIPAHIWTPWFSLLGSKSGFDAVEECFEDLTPHIFAVETGLSSDPEMNWRVSNLDGLTLVSNSDAHSPLNLGREANLFDANLEYQAIKTALASSDSEKFLGTFEFYPEEGKYHLDGHRLCNVCLQPDESMKHNGKCPECGKPLTLGVLYRVMELADRHNGAKPETCHPFYSMIPLAEILSEIFNVGPKSKKVQKNYNSVLQKLGPEFKILHILDPEDIKKANIPLLSKAIDRMRRKKVIRYPGYDGEFGKIKLFEADERERLLGQQDLFSVPVSDAVSKKNQARQETKHSKKKLLPVKPQIKKPEPKQTDILADLNDQQQKAVTHKGGPLLIVAGPGTGKTRTLTHRIAYLIHHKGILPEHILAVTFTNKASREMSDRLKLLLDGLAPLPFVATFHSLCLKILQETGNNDISIIDDYDRLSIISQAIQIVEQKGLSVPVDTQLLFDKIITAKQHALGPDDDLEAIAGEVEHSLLTLVYAAYQDLLSAQGLYDYEDLIVNVIKLFQEDKKICGKYQKKFQYIFVDEYQDLNKGQYLIIKALAPLGKNMCVIGDPDQSIYGFRGSDVVYFNSFVNDYPEADVINLTRNYRSTETILEASYQIIMDQSFNISGSRVYSGIDGEKTISVIECATEKAEAVSVGKIIEKMIGGMGFHAIDFGKVDGSRHSSGDRGFSDFAIFYRTKAQARAISESFDQYGIPYQIVNKENEFYRKGLLELISFLKVIEGSGSYADLLRTVTISGPGIGKKTLGRLHIWCYQNRLSLKKALTSVRRIPIQGMSNAQQLKLDEFLKNMVKMQKTLADMTIEHKLSYLYENTDKILSTIEKDPKTKDAYNRLVTIAKSFGTNTPDFLLTLSLQKDIDTYDDHTEKVTLMTMHASKGLEFPVVFITGCEKDYLPYKRSGHNQQDLDEERRLFYVAMTRAKENLYLTWSKKRRIYGKLEKREMSLFVKNIEKRLRDHESPAVKKQKKEAHIQLELF